MARKNTTFFDLLPFSFVLEKHIETPEQIRKLFVEGIRNSIPFYAVNQSDKCLRMIKWGYEETEQPPFERRFHDREEMVIITRGDLFKISRVDQFDKLYKGVLNEIDLCIELNGLDELIEYQQSEYLFQMHANKNALTHPSKFESVGFQHVYIGKVGIEKIIEATKGKSEQKESKQAKREKLFISWLKDKDHQAVQNMKKEEVWAELKNLDRLLFGVESKNFFRDQKIITFKAGRKPN